MAYDFSIDELRRQKLQSLSPLESSIISNFTNPHVFLSKDGTGGLSLAFPARDFEAYNIPRQISSVAPVFQYNTQKMQVLRTMEQSGSSHFDILSSTDSFTAALSRGAERGMRDPANFRFKVGRALRDYGVNYFKDISTGTGGLSVGEVALTRQTGILKFSPRYSAMRGANSIEYAETQFVKSLFSNDMSVSVTEKFSAARKSYIDHMEKVLEMTSGQGHRLHTIGIKSLSFERSRSDLIMKLGVGDPEGLLAMGWASRFSLGGRAHEMRYLPVPMDTRELNDIDPNRFFALVGGNKFSSNWKAARELAGSVNNPANIGAGYRTKVSYLMGENAGALWSLVGGDSAYFVSDDVAKVIGSSTLEYKRYVKGLVGPDSPNGTSRLHKQLTEHPEIAEFMMDPSRRSFRPSAPITLETKALALRTGKKLRAVTADAIGDQIVEMSKTSTGLTFIMRNTGNPGFVESTPILVNGVKGSARSSVGTGRGSFVLGYGGKLSDPIYSRQQWLSHYAAVAEDLGPISGRKARLEKLAKHIGGLEVQTIDANRHIYQLSTTADFYKPNNVFGEGSTDYGSQKFMNQLSELFGQKAGAFEPVSRQADKEEILEIISAGGRMPLDKARKMYGHLFDGKLKILDFKQGFVQTRSTPIDHTPGKAAKKLARLRLKYGRSLRNTIDNAIRTTADPASKAALINMRKSIQGSISAQEKPLFTMMAAIRAPLSNDAETAIAKVIAASDGKIGRLDLASMPSDKKDRVVSLFKELNKNKSLTDAQYKELNELVHGGQGKYGTYIDMAEEAIVHSGGTGKDDIARASKTIFLPSLDSAAPELGQESASGWAGDMKVIPRSPIAAGKHVGEQRALNPIATIINATEEVFNPGARKGSLTERLFLLNRSVIEGIIGRKGLISKSSMGGVRGARLNAALYTGAAPGEAIVAMTERAIKDTFGKDFGGELIRRHKSGQGVYGFASRDPILSTMGHVPTRLEIISEKRAAEFLGKGTARSKVNSTMYLSRPLQAMIDADYDGDLVQFLLHYNKGTQGLDENQVGMKALYDAQKEGMAVFDQLIEMRAKAGDKKTAELIAANASIFDISVGGKNGKASSFTNAVDELIRNMDKLAPDAVITDARREATAAFVRRASNKHVGVITAFIEGQQAALSTLTGSSEYFNLEKGFLEDILNKTGLSQEQLSRHGSSEYARQVYGFLKKGSQYQEQTAEFIDIMRNARGLNIGGDEWNKTVERGAKLAQFFSEGMPQSGTSYFDISNPEAVKFAQQAISSGEAAMPLDYYKQIVDTGMRVSVAKQQIERRGAKTVAYKTGGVRAPEGTISPVMTGVIGEEVSFPRGYQGPEHLTDELRDVAERYGNGAMAQDVTDVAADAAIGVAERAEKVKSMLEGAKGWGGLKWVAGGAAAMAAYSLISSGGGEVAPPEIPEAGLPPNPMMGQPSDGGRPTYRAPRQNHAYINRVPGQRTHFPQEDRFFLSRPSYDTIDNGGSEYSLGSPNRARGRTLTSRD